LALIETDIPKNIKINKDFDPSIPLISFDLSLIEQALLNIIKNAQESLISNSTLDPIISVKTRISHQEYIGKTRYGTICKIEIEDNGIGIPESIKDSVFFPMISGKEHGNGLGLAITQGILYQHSGSVECKSRPGRTVFTFMLPLKNSNIEEYFTGEVINAK
jgi:two-component system nitrogen regulation sensor histidine kinase GlnL